MMKNYLKHYIWFWKESFSFMEGTPKHEIIWGCIQRGHKFAKNMYEWDKLNAEQREAWYLSGEGRTFEI
jgi:hypothetical protein